MQQSEKLGRCPIPAKSARQQRFFGYLKSHPLEAAAKGISPKVVDEFAHAPGGTLKGLPTSVPKVKPKKAPSAPKLGRIHFGSLSPED